MVHLWSTNNPTNTTNTATRCGEPAGQTTNKDNTVTILRQRVSKVRILPGAPSPAPTPIRARTEQAGWSTNGPHSFRPAMRRTKAFAEYVGVSLLAVLYGTAFAAFGFYVSLFLDALGVPEYWMLAWVAAGSAAGTVWLLRYAGIDVRRRVYRPARKAGQR